MAVDVLDQLTRRVLAEHPFDIKSRKINGSTTHYWVECPCGYRTEPGPSRRRHAGAALGHLKRVYRMLERGELPVDIRRVG